MAMRGMSRTLALRSAEAPIVSRSISVEEVASARFPGGVGGGTGSAKSFQFDFHEMLRSLSCSCCHRDSISTLFFLLLSPRHPQFQTAVPQNHTNRGMTLHLYSAWPVSDRWGTVL